jgi:thioredoxin-related protein
MIKTFFPTLIFALSNITAWHSNLDEAKLIAKSEHKLVLLNFSGSDWCGPCIRLRQEIFESATFQAMAERNLVLVNADFPRMKKNQLSPQQQQLNNSMADRYNSKGRFPFTVLMDEDGHPLKEWDGFPNASPEQFSASIEEIVHSSKPTH